MTDAEVIRVGAKAGKKAPAGFEDWEIFKLSFGFYKWAKKNELTDEQKELFGKAFNGQHS